jgi:hypothetical protein
MRYITLGDTFDFKFTTRRFSSGAPFTLAGSPAVAAYPGNSTTEITAGITLTVDFDSRTGLHNVRIVATSGNGYAAGFYAVVITAGTVDSVSVVGEVVYEFVIGSVPADVRAWNGTAPNNLVSGRVDTQTGAIAAGTITAAAFAAGAIDANAIATDAIGSAEISAAAVTKIQTGLATSAALATVQADTDDIQTRLPAALVSGRMDASVGAMAANVLTASAINAAAITAAKFATDAIDANALAATAVTKIQSGLATSAALATVQADTDDIQTRLPAALVGGRMSSQVGAMANDVITAAALATDAGDEIADKVADAVWDEVLAGHLTAGTTGAALNGAGSAGDPWGTALPGAYGAGTAGAILGTNLNATVSSRASQTSVDTKASQASVDAMQADTDNLQTRLPAALVSGRMDASVGAMATDTLTAAALATDAVTEIQAGLASASALAAVAAAIAALNDITTDEVWDAVIEGAITARQSLRLANAANGGKVSGAGTSTVTIRDLADSKNRVVATVSSGNRTAVTRDLT